MLNGTLCPHYNLKPMHTTQQTGYIHLMAFNRGPPLKLLGESILLFLYSHMYLCLSAADALRVHVMRERYLWRTTLEGVLEEGHTSTSERYPDLPQGVTAAAEDYRGTTYFFQGDSMIKIMLISHSNVLF